jgi:hypothetical protein
MWYAEMMKVVNTCFRANKKGPLMSTLLFVANTEHGENNGKLGYGEIGDQI